MDHDQITSGPEILPIPQPAFPMTIRPAASARGLLSTALTATLLVGIFPREASGQG